MQKLFISNNTIFLGILGFYILGIAIAILFPDTYLVNLTILCLILTGIIFKTPYKKVILISLIMFIIGFNYCISMTPKISDNDISLIAPQKNIVVIGIVDSEPITRGDGKLKFQFKVEKVELDGKTIDKSGNILVSVYDKYQQFGVIKIGQQLKLLGRLFIPKSASNPGQFDYKKYISNQGIYANMTVLWKDYQILNLPEGFLYQLLNSLSLLKSSIQSVHDKYLSEDNAQLLGGIVLGDKAVPIKKETYRTFVNAGLAHVLAASGINVALLALAWMFVVSRLNLPYFIQISGGMIIILIYCMIAGMSPSVIRSGIMLEFILIGKLINKNADMVTLIAFVCAILLTYNPFMFYDIGFQLSFVATFGLIISVGVFQKYITVIPEWIAMLVLVPFIAQLWTLPIQLYHFHTIQSYSVITNFLSMPLIAIITYFGFLSSFLAIIPIIGDTLTGFIDFCLQPFLSLQLYIANSAANAPHSINYLSFNSLWEVFLIYLFIAILLFAMWKNYKNTFYLIIITLITIAVITVSIFKTKDTLLNVIFFDVGNADSILIKTPDDKYYLIDGGKRGENICSSNNSIVCSYLHTKGIYKLNGVMLTHPENDHIGCLPEIINDFEVENYYDIGLPSRNKAYNKLLSTLYRKKIPYNIVRKFDEIKFSKKLRLKVLNPPEYPSYKKSLNKKSLLLRLDYSNFSMLLTGDTEVDVLDRVQKSDLDVDILKAGHHGSKKSLSEEYLEATTPKAVIISGGQDEKHPSKTTLDILKKHHLPTYITYKVGSVKVTSDGKTYNISTFLEQ